MTGCPRLGSFYAYLNYDSKKDFVIDFDSVWKWTGFSRKDPAKRVLEKNFVIQVDYKVETYAPVSSGAGFEDEKGFPQLGGNDFEDVIQDGKGFPQLEGKGFKDEESKSPEINKGGRPKEKILLTVNTFKKFCLKANTKKADEIHDYYIKLEELLQETINEESEELRLQLIDSSNEKNRLEKEKKILETNYKKSTNEIEKLSKMLHKKFEPKVITEEKFVVYLLVAYINDRTVYIIGKTGNLNKRFRAYKVKGLLIPEEDIRLEYFKSCRSASILNIVESNIILKMSKYILNGTREVFETDEMDETEMVNKFKEVIDFFVNCFDDVLEHIKIEKKDEKEDNRVRTELYLEENRDEVNERVRDDRKENPDKYRERENKRDPVKKKAKNKRYYEKNKEEILKKQSEYNKRPKNIERIAENKRRSYENNKEERLEYLKEYRKEKKEEIKKSKTQKIKCLICEATITLQCWKRHTTGIAHNDCKKMKPDVEEDYEFVSDNN